jgi:hypothetical protein
MDLLSRLGWSLVRYYNHKVVTSLPVQARSAGLASTGAAGDAVVQTAGLHGTIKVLIRAIHQKQEVSSR